MQRIHTNLGLVGLCWLVACGGGGGSPDAGPVDASRRDAQADAAHDAAGLDASVDGSVDAGFDASFDAGPPPDFTEPAGADTDPFLGGAAASTGVDLSDGTSARFGGTIAAGGGNDTWADSDGYGFHVASETRVQARLSFIASSRIYSVAIHRADRHLVAYWAMSRSGQARTTPMTLPVGDYFVHVAAAPPALAAPEPYMVELVAGSLPGCASAASPGYTEIETAAALDSNDLRTVVLDGMPRITDSTGASEVTGLSVVDATPVAFEGVSGDAPTGADSYLDRDSYRVHTGADVHELEVLLEHISADVNMDVMIFDAADGRLVGTGIAISDSPEHASAVVEPDHDYDVWVGARDERRIGGDTALPLTYQASICGFGASR